MCGGEQRKSVAIRQLSFSEYVSSITFADSPDALVCSAEERDLKSTTRKPDSHILLEPLISINK